MRNLEKFGVVGFRWWSLVNITHVDTSDTESCALTSAYFARFGAYFGLLRLTRHWPELTALGCRPTAHPTCANMVLTTQTLATADQIVLQHAELLQVLGDVRKRNNGGRNDKHDTARVRFIKDFALRGLRFGKLVPTADLDMIRLEPKVQLSGPKLASIDAWDKRHAPDPRSANEGVAIDLTVEQLGFQERG